MIVSRRPPLPSDLADITNDPRTQSPELPSPSDVADIDSSRPLLSTPAHEDGTEQLWKLPQDASTT